MRKLGLLAVLVVSSSAFSAVRYDLAISIYNNSHHPLPLSCHGVGRVKLQHPVNGMIIAPNGGQLDISAATEQARGDLIRCDTAHDDIEGTYFIYSYQSEQGQSIRTNGEFALEEDYDGVVDYFKSY